MRRGKVQQQTRARILRAQGKSLNEIVKALGVSKSSVSVWVRDIPLSEHYAQRLKQRELRGARKGNLVLEKKWKEYRKKHPKTVRSPRWPKRSVDSFFHTWTPDMAYVLGYFAADGCMYQNKRGSKYIGFTSVDPELIDTVKRIMDISNTIEQYTKKGKNWKTKYTIQIGSRKVYERLLEMKFTPNKSLTLQFPEVPIKLLPHFVRGYFDGDGCVHVGVYKSKRRFGKTVTIFTTQFTSASKEFLLTLRNKLTKQGKLGRGSLIKKQRGGYALSYAARDSRLLYEFMYPTSTVPCLKRKRDIFEKRITGA